MCDSRKKKDSSQKDSRLTILQARAIDHPRTAVRREPKREAGLNFLSAEIVLI